jgi:hypothetical protein
MADASLTSLSNTRKGHGCYSLASLSQTIAQLPPRALQRHSIMDCNDQGTEEEPSSATVEALSIFDDVKHQYWRDIVDYAKFSRERNDAARLPVDEPPLGDFRKLQIMNIVHLLNQISQIKGKVEHSERASPQIMKDLRETLHQYGTNNEVHFVKLNTC